MSVALESLRSADAVEIRGDRAGACVCVCVVHWPGRPRVQIYVRESPLPLCFRNSCPPPPSENVSANNK